MEGGGGRLFQSEGEGGGEGTGRGGREGGVNGRGGDSPPTVHYRFAPLATCVLKNYSRKNGCNIVSKISGIIDKTFC
jgi:hypothetical protein